MKIRMILTLTVVAATALYYLAGCGKSGGSELAVVGDSKITVTDFLNFTRDYRMNYTSAQYEFDLKKDILDTMIVHRLLVQAAYEKNIDKLEEVARVVLANRDKFLLDALYHEHIASKVVVTEAETRDFWDHLEYRIRASHILVPSEDTANMLFEKIKNGENFEQLAYEHSIDPSAKRNRGDLGYFTWGTMVDEFEEMAFNMEPDEISPPVKSKFGYHIIKLVDRQFNDTREPFDRIQNKLIGQLEAKKRFALTEDYYKTIKGKYPVELDRTVADYVTHKRLNLYPPQLLGSVPKNDFDEEQLDRNERELVLATWEGGQMSLIEYLLISRRQLPPQMKPDFDDYDSLETVLFELKKTEILAYEASREGLENSDEFKRNMRYFKEYSMAEIMRNDSLPMPAPPTEQDLRDYYDQNPEEFANPRKIHLYEIQVKDEHLAKKLAREIKSLEEFREKASELTERSGTRLKRGDLGYIEYKWFEDIFDVAWETPIGAIGGPVPTRGRHSIFYPVDRVEKEYKDFLGVKREIHNKLLGQQHKDAFDQWIEERKAITNVKTYYDVLWETIDKEAYAVVDSTIEANP